MSDYKNVGTDHKIEAKIIHIQTAPQAWVDYKIRVKIDGKFYTGELELSE